MADQSEPRQAQRGGSGWLFVTAPVVAVLAVWGLNFLFVGQPVQKAVRADSRNQGYSLSAHYGYYVNPNVLVLDLSAVESAAPVDLFRGLFQSAKALHESGRRFDKVVLAKDGTPVFLMEGKEFSALGAEFSAGQNPVYLIRTLPEKLFRPTGQAAFGRWEGGWLGVLGKQIGDANEAGNQWASGR
jgi:hypothetical protein